jgi:hypothetical protein
VPPVTIFNAAPAAITDAPPNGPASSSAPVEMAALAPPPSISRAAAPTNAVALPKGAMRSPAPGSTLAGPIETFTWVPANARTNYYLWVGTTGAGSRNLIVSEKTTTNSIDIGDLPTDGETIYIRLWAEPTPDNFTFTDYVYKAATATN